MTALDLAACVAEIESLSEVLRIETNACQNYKGRADTLAADVKRLLEENAGLGKRECELLHDNSRLAQENLKLRDECTSTHASLARLRGWE